MDKRVIFAVAGSGKTTKIVDAIDERRRFLVLTYTDENIDNLRNKIAAKYGRTPSNIAVMTYFTFLYSFCFRPLAGLELRSRGINFKDRPSQGRYDQSHRKYYFDGSGRLYVARLAKLISQKFLKGVIEHLERFFDVICIDEVQDFASHDFTLLLQLAEAKVEMLLVGDFRQHTYDTSRDGSTRKSLHEDFAAYAKHFADAGIEVDTESLGSSWRCSPAICTFIRDRIGIPIQSSSGRNAEIVLVSSSDQAEQLYSNPLVVKLFYQEHHKYGCFSQNWGASKGEDHYDEVCVVLNQTTKKAFDKGNLRSLSPSTINKLYVALSRARGNVYLVPHTFYDKHKVRALTS